LEDLNLEQLPNKAIYLYLRGIDIQSVLVDNAFNISLPKDIYDRVEQGIGLLDKIIGRRNYLVILAFIESQEDIYSEYISTAVILGV